MNPEGTRLACGAFEAQPVELANLTNAQVLIGRLIILVCFVGRPARQQARRQDTSCERRPTISALRQVPERRAHRPATTQETGDRMLIKVKIFGTHR
jgi:hypothetical protein